MCHQVSGKVSWRGKLLEQLLRLIYLLTQHIDVDASDRRDVNRAHVSPPKLRVGSLGDLLSSPVLG